MPAPALLFIKKFEAKSDAYAAKLKFFEPKWAEAKRQVFSSSSSSNHSSSTTDTSTEDSKELSNHSIIKSAWAATISSHHQRKQVELWAAAAVGPSDIAKSSRSQQ